jgi:hypothetical protein
VLLRLTNSREDWLPPERVRSHLHRVSAKRLRSKLLMAPKAERVSLRPSYSSLVS